MHQTNSSSGRHDVIRRLRDLDGLESTLVDDVARSCVGQSLLSTVYAGDERTNTTLSRKCSWMHFSGADARLEDTLRRSLITTTICRRTARESVMQRGCSRQTTVGILDCCAAEAEAIIRD